MGDDSPDEIQLVCTSCETEFVHEGATGRLPSVPCPECGEPVSLRGSDPEEGGEDESPPEAQVVEAASDGPSPPEGADGTSQTLMGVGPQAVSAEDAEKEDESKSGESEDADGGGTPLAKITSEKKRVEKGADEDGAAEESSSDASTEDASGSAESGGDESVDRSFAGAGGDDDVHDRETSVSREPLSKMSPGEDGGEKEASDIGAVGDESSDGGRLSDLKRRLQQARHKDEDKADGDDENPFTDADGNVGSEETRVAADSGLDDGFGQEADADGAMEVTVEGDESTEDDGADEEIPEPDVEFGGGDEPQDSRAEHRETKPAGEDTILETMQSGGEGSDDPDESVETAEQSLPEEAVETAERTNPEEAETAEQPVADANEETSPADTPAARESSDSGGDAQVAEEADSGGEPEVVDESEKETEPNVDGGVPGPDEMDQQAGLGSDSSVPRPDEIGGDDEQEASDSGGEPSQKTGLGGSSSVPRPEDVRAGDDGEADEDQEPSASDAEAESGSEPPADVDEETRKALEEAEEDLDLEQMSREMADEASDIINEMRDDGELEPNAAVENGDGAGEGGYGAPPIPGEEEEGAAEEGGSGAPPIPEDVGTKSEPDTSGEETEANPPPKPDSGSGSIPAPESDSSADDSRGADQRAGEGEASDSGAASPAKADRSGEELPKPVAEADVEFPDTLPGEESADSPAPPEDGSPPSSSLSPAPEQGEPPTPSESGRSEPPSDPKPTADDSGGGSTTLLVGAGLAGVVLIGVGIFFLVDPMGLQKSGSEEASEAAAEKKKKKDKKKADRNKKVGQAVQAARSTLGEATAVDVPDADLQREVADRLAERGDARAASRIYDVLWDPSAEDTELANRYIDLLMEGERFRRARRVAIQAIGFADGGAGFEKRFDKTLEADEALGSWDPVDLDDYSEVASLGASSDVDYSGLVLRDDAGQPVGLWRPATDEDGPWRDSIAAWRFCQIVACQFEIPRTRPSRISRSTFEAKFDGESGDLDSEKFDWVTREGPDGGEVEYLYGALREWPGEVTRWPIEAYEVWRPWLTVGGETEVMDQPVSEVMGDFEDLGDGSLHEGVVAESAGLEVRPVARQLSGILTFDFLTNNWGRFEDDEADYGASNHFADGHFVTLETETVFQRRKSTRVKGRFRWISRFSGDMIRSIRLLDKQSTRAMLYPNASAIEEAKFDIVWEQREALLSRVDELTDEHGRDQVIFFQ